MIYGSQHVDHIYIYYIYIYYITPKKTPTFNHQQIPILHITLIFSIFSSNKQFHKSPFTLISITISISTKTHPTHHQSQQQWHFPKFLNSHSGITSSPINLNSINSHNSITFNSHLLINRSYHQTNSNKPVTFYIPT